MIIFECVSNYMNTPKIELSAEDEIMLYIAIAIAIALLVVLGSMVVAAYAFKMIRSLITNARERFNTNRKR